MAIRDLSGAFSGGQASGADLRRPADRPAVASEASRGSADGPATHLTGPAEQGTSTQDRASAKLDTSNPGAPTASTERPLDGHGLGEHGLDAIDVAVDLLLKQVEDLSGRQASAQLAHVTRTVAKLSAYRVALVARVNSSRVWQENSNHPNPGSFLREELVADHHEVATDLRAAASFGRFPLLADACREGRVSRDKMDLILRTGLRNQAREDALPQFMPIFVEMAETVPVSGLRKVLEHWAEQVDPVTTARDEDAAHSRRELHVIELRDGVKIDGFFGKVQGMQLLAALNGALAAQWAANGPTPAGDSSQHGGSSSGRSVNSSRHGGSSSQQRVSEDPARMGELVSRATAQQRADAFIDAIIAPVLSNKLLPTSGGTAATVCVTVPLDRLELPDTPVGLDALHASVGDGSLRLNSPAIRATNGPGQAVLSTTTALTLSCDSTVQRVILSPAGKPLDIGRKTRTIPEHIRTALIVRDGGCIYPLCDRPPGWTHAHHIVHWSQGGPTKLDNLALLCSRHHHKIHSDNIAITMSASGLPQVAIPYHRKP